MTELLETVDAIAGRYRAMLCDVWGCYHDGVSPYPSAVEALIRYREAGGLVVLLTNAPRPAASVARFLEGMGAPSESWDAILSSGEACQRAIASGRHGRRFHYVGPGRDLHMLTDVGLDPAPLGEADAVLCTGLADDATETPEDYAPRIAEWVARELPLLCANPDIVVDRGSQRLWCAGALAEAHRKAGGEVISFGKPHRPIYDEAMAVLAELAGEPVPREAVLALGDGIATDVAGAIGAGLDVVFVAGGLAAAEMGPDPDRPDPARLKAYLEAARLAPPYAIGRLR